MCVRTWFSGTVLCLGVPAEARCAQLALIARRHGGAAQAAACVWIAHLGRTAGVCIAMTLTGKTRPLRAEESRGAGEAAWPSVAGQARVTYSLACRVWGRANERR